MLFLTARSFQKLQEGWSAIEFTGFCCWLLRELKKKKKLNKSTEALCTNEDAVIMIHIDTQGLKVNQVTCFLSLFFFFMVKVNIIVPLFFCKKQDVCLQSNEDLQRLTQESRGLGKLRESRTVVHTVLVSAEPFSKRKTAKYWDFLYEN